MTSTETVYRALRLVYDAALQPEIWPEAMDALALTMGAHKSLLSDTLDHKTVSFLTTGMERDSAIRFQREFIGHLPDWIEMIPTGEPLRQTAAVSDDTFRRSKIYIEAVRPAGGFYGMVMPLKRQPGREVYYVIGRNFGAPDFSDADVNTARLLIPHLQTALEIQGRLNLVQARIRGALDFLTELAVAVILLDARFRPVFVNPSANALAARRDGLLLSHSAVYASLPEETLMLRNAVMSAMQCRAQQNRSEARTPFHCALTRQKHAPLRVDVMPLCVGGALNDSKLEAKTMLLITEQEQSPKAASTVSGAMFGLTRREAEVAELIVRGSDIAGAATRLGIGVGTARSYLKQVLAKTGTHRQAELVSLMLRS